MNSGARNDQYMRDTSLIYIMGVFFDLPVQAA